MARFMRTTHSGTLYHGTPTVKNTTPCSSAGVTGNRFLNILTQLLKKNDVVIHAYCLMGNHYYLLPEKYSRSLPQIMRHFNGVYTPYFTAQYARSGHLLQGRQQLNPIDPQKLS